MRGPVKSFLVWTILYAMLLGAALALAPAVSLWFFALAALFVWRLLWNARRLLLWMRDCSDAVGV